MIDSRARSEVGALARARRFLGRVLDTVRGSEPPPELVPDAPSLAVPPAPRMPTRVDESEAHALHEPARVTDPDPRPSPIVALARVVDLAPTLQRDELARTLLEDASWTGLRCEEREGRALVAWRDPAGAAALLRTIEIRCALGALDASPEVIVNDRPVHSAEGATSFTSDALRVVVAIGSMHEGSFVSMAHAHVR